MNALTIIGIIFACLCLALMGWSLVRINYPRTPEEERAVWERDLKEDVDNG